MLKELLSTAARSKALDTKDVERVNVDTTVQEKAIAFPTDARLYEKARSAEGRSQAAPELQTPWQGSALQSEPLRLPAHTIKYKDAVTLAYSALYDKRGGTVEVEIKESNWKP
jgi:hypothetical protein